MWNLWKGKSRFIGCFGFLLACTSLSLFAEDGQKGLSNSCTSVQRPLCIAELVDIALTNHPSTKQAWWNARRAAAAIGTATSEYYPHLNAKAEVSAGREHQFINGPDKHFSEIGAGLDLSMMLYDCGKTHAAVEATKKLLQAASWRSDWNIQTVMIHVFEAAYEWLYAREVYESALLSLKEAEKMYAAATDLNQAGLKPISDVYSSRANLSSMKMEESAKRALFRTSGAKLALSLGLSATTVLSVEPVGVNDHPYTKETLDQLLTRASEQRADLHSKQAEYAAAVLDVEREEKSTWPRLSFVGDGGIKRYKNEPVGARNSSRKGSNNLLQSSGTYSAGLRLDLPLFTGFEATYKKQEALATANVTQAEVSELQVQISSDIATASYALESAQEMIPEAQESLDDAMRAYDATFARYSAGKGEMVELYDAQQQVSSARMQQSRVKMEWLTAIVKLAYVTGDRLQ